MNLTWHIVKKDFRKQRWPLVLWTGLLLAQIFIGERMFSPASLNAGWLDLQRTVLGVLSAIGWIVAYMIAGSVVMEDPLVGTQVFWVTRPISGGRLLGAKLLGLAIMFLLWPALLMMSWWLLGGFGWSAVGLDVLQVILAIAMPLVGAVTLATVARQSSHFLLGTLLFLIVLPIAGSLMATKMTVGQNLQPTLMSTKTLLCVGLMGITCLAVIGLQYFIRRIRWAMALLIAGSAAGIVTAAWWPIDLMKYSPDTSTQSVGTEALTVEFLKATVWSRNNSSTAGDISVMFDLIFRGIPQEECIAGGQLEINLSWPDGSKWQHSGQIVGTNVRSMRPPNHLFGLTPDHLGLAVDPRKSPFPKDARSDNSAQTEKLPVATVSIVSWATVYFPSDLIEKIQRQAPTCTLALRFKLNHPVFQWEMPLHDGAQIAAKSLRALILQRSPLPASAEGKPSSGEITTMITAQLTNGVPDYYLIDRSQGTSERLSGNDDKSPNLLPFSPKFTLVYFKVPASASQFSRNAAGTAASDRSENDTIAAVTYEEGGGFNREIKIDRLELTPPEPLVIFRRSAPSSKTNRTEK